MGEQLLQTNIKPLIVHPTYDGRFHREGMEAVFNAVASLPGTVYRDGAHSALTLQFNQLWCDVLNHKEFTHWVMFHADIVPLDPNWMTKLIALADGNGADVLSVVAPIKNALGLTSTAIARGNKFGDFRRVTMKELPKLPEVFGAKDVAEMFGWNPKASRLMVNTGLMCVRMEKRRVLETMCFQVNSWIKRNDKGEFYAVFEPEDWHWSEQANAKGLKVMATRAIPLAHMGEMAYRNDAEWGIDHDGGDPKK